MNIPLLDLQESETIGRRVFSHRNARRARNGRIVPEVFLESLEAESISVDRTDLAKTIVLAAIAQQAGQNRTPQKRFYGWGTIQVGAAASNGRSVRATPDGNNPYHADIYLNLPCDQELRDMQKQHANELAALAKWLDAP